MRFFLSALAALSIFTTHVRAADPVITVTTARVAEKRTTATTHGTGLVAPWKEVAVTAGVQGVVIKKIAVEAGDIIEAGDEIATFDSRTLKAAIERAKSAVAAADATLAGAEAALSRGKALYAASALSVEKMEALETAVVQAHSARNQAVSSMGDMVIAAEDGKLVSPVNGIVLMVASNAGATSGTSPLVTIAQEGRLEVTADIPEKRLSSIFAGQRADITGLDGKRRTGTVRTVAPVVNPQTHMGSVTVTLDDADGMKPGMFARVAIEADAGVSTVVPAAAVTYRANSPKVFAMTPEGRVKAISVRPLATKEGETSIVGDIRDGDAVVVDGAGFVEDGDLVKIGETNR